MEKYLAQIQHARFNNKIYLLGNFEKRVTVYSQQIRTTNLIYSLHKSNILKEKSKIAIIGGGVAGLTAAATAILLGCKDIQIFEQGTSLLPLWKNCSSRWLHPNIFNWPNENWYVEDTNLPILNWKYGLAKDVAKQMLTEWETLLDYYKTTITVTVTCNTKARINEESNKISWGKYGDVENFDLIFVAVGFGRDGKRNDESTCYWANDNIVALKEEKDSYFLSGNGDGGIADLCRLRIEEYDLDKLISWLKSSEVENLKSKIRGLETIATKKFLDEGLDSANHYLQKSYNKIDTPILNERIKRTLREDNLVYFHSRSEFMYNVNSFPLNRFLLSRLVQIEDSNLAFISGELRNLTSLNKTDLSRNDIEIDIKNFDKITANIFISRHGPLSPLTREGLKWMYDSKKAESLKNKNELDQTGNKLLSDVNKLKSSIPFLQKLNTMQGKEVIAIALVKHKKDNKFIFTERRSPEPHLQWGFPAKRIKKYYNVESAIVSECEQETGITPRVIRFIGSRIHKETGNVLEYWYCEHAKGRLKIGDPNELRDVQWVDGIEIIKRTEDLFSPLKTILHGTSN